MIESLVFMLFVIPTYMRIFFLYIVGPIPHYLWCESRRYYRNVGSMLLPYPVDSYIPDEVPFPEVWESSLIGDLVNSYNMARFTILTTHRGAVEKTLRYLESPVTYGVCPGDPDYYYMYKVFGVILLAVMLVFIVSYIALYCYEFNWRYYVSKMLYHSNLCEVRPEFYRSIFAQQQNVIPIEIAGHSHPKAASHRNADSMFIRQFALNSGCEPFYFQCSAADQRNHLKGSRNYFWAKDINVEPMDIDIPENAVIGMVDVDQYIDMPYFLARNDKPVLVATVQPTACAGNVDNFSFTFDSDSVLHYNVCGSAAEYIHPVWNYNVDTIVAIAWFWFIPYSAVTYSVDRRTTSKHHDIIALIPTGYWGFFSAIAYALFGKSSLRRLDLLRGTHLRMKVQTVNGMYVSTARPMQYAVANVSAVVDDTISNLAVVGKSGLTRAAIESHLPISTTPDEQERNRAAATVLLDFYSHNNDKYSFAELAARVANRMSGATLLRPTPEVVSPCNNNPPVVRRYQFNKFDEDAKPILEAYMNPLFDNAFAPDKTKENEQRAVDKRILDVASDKDVTPFITTCMTEFLEMLIPVPHLRVPLDVDEVWERQNRPTQRVHLEEADQTGTPNRIAKTFIKAEAYADVKDPRIITTYNAKDKVNYSRFTYVVAEWLKNLPCYAFSKAPNEVDEAVVRTCSGAKTVAKTDFSRLDGTISRACRTLETSLLYRLFSPSYHKELQDLHKSQYNIFAVCAMGSRYAIKTARGSGSAETSAFNTIVNMFATYLGHRMSPGECTQFCTPRESFDKMYGGLYGGDDGLSRDVNVPGYKKACASLGLNVKAENINNGSFGIVFLSRVYGPDVWNGDTSNCADLPKQLGKLHTTTIRPHVSKEQKLIDKISGFNLSDANTPVLGEFVVRAMAINNGNLLPSPEHMNWLVKNAAKLEGVDVSDLDPLVFNNPKRDWYEEYFTSIMPTFNRKRFSQWLSTTVTLQDIMQCPCFIERPAPVIPAGVTVAVDGELYTPTTSDVKPTKRNNNKPVDKRNAFKRRQDEKQRKINVKDKTSPKQERTHGKRAM